MRIGGEDDKTGAERPARRESAERNQPDPNQAECDRIEREVRSRREFSMAEAIGRMASDGFLKGASPVPRLRQVELELEHYLETHLMDGPGALRQALRVEIERNSTLLAEHLDDPRQALGKIIKALLGAEVRLTQFVTEVDAAWGRLYQESPIFEKPGEPADPDDPYTLDTVRTKLEDLCAKLGEGEGSSR